MLDVTLFYRVTTPEFTYTLPKDSSEYDVIRVSFWQGNYMFVKSWSRSGSDRGIMVDENRVIVTLTQEETMGFQRGFCKTQVRILGNNLLNVDASEEFRIVVADVKDEVILGGK